MIHSCMLQLIEVICRINPQAIQEFLYSELPQEMVAEMQQHHNGPYESPISSIKTIKN